MKEIEVKILNVDAGRLGKKLKDIGAKKMFEGDVHVIFYDFKGGPLRRRGKRLRLRKMGERIELTFKQKLAKERVKVAEELETVVDNFEMMQEILKSIGCIEEQVYHKHRTSYRLNRVFFEIDIINGCPPLLEIEAGSEETVYAWVEKLGFSADRAKAWSGTDVIEYYKEKKFG